MPRKNEDRFANMAALSVTESSAGTMTFAELQLGINFGQGIGILIDQLEYYFDAATLEDIVLAGDQLEGGWFTTNLMTAFDVLDKRQLHQVSVGLVAFGTPASANLTYQPTPFQFFPPLIQASPRVYLGVLGTSLAAAAILRSRLYFRFINLTDKEYLEIAETFILVG